MHREHGTHRLEHRSAPVSQVPERLSPCGFGHGSGCPTTSLGVERFEHGCGAGGLKDVLEVDQQRRDHGPRALIAFDPTHLRGFAAGGLEMPVGHGLVPQVLRVPRRSVEIVAGDRFPCRRVEVSSDAAVVVARRVGQQCFAVS